MDRDRVRILLILGPADNPSFTWTPVTDRWRARDACRDFAYGVEWEGKPVLRALIVEVG